MEQLSLNCRTNLCCIILHSNVGSQFKRSSQVCLIPMVDEIPEVILQPWSRSEDKGFAETPPQSIAFFTRQFVRRSVTVRFSYHALSRGIQFKIPFKPHWRQRERKVHFLTKQSFEPFWGNIFQRERFFSHRLLVGLINFSLECCIYSHGLDICKVVDESFLHHDIYIRHRKGLCQAKPKEFSKLIRQSLKISSTR